jgi:HlyD family secretion protein
MLREVKGTGTLVPEETRWVAALTRGRVERILALAGRTIEPNTVILELSNPELQLAALEAEAQLREAQARHQELGVNLESARLQQEATAEQIESEFHQAELDADIQAQMAKEGLTSNLKLQTAQFLEKKLGGRHRIEQKRVAISGDAYKAQLAVSTSQVERQRGVARLKRAEADALHVRAGVGGVLQVVNVEVGQQVEPGTNLARVARPEKLKAVIRVPETQAKDVQIGHPASVDTRNGIIPAHVVRVDPAVREGTVTIDLALDGPLPKGARPDLTVDASIEIERLDDVLHVGRPASVQEGGTLGLFKLDASGGAATRVKVTLGRTSVNAVEIVSGLAEGDQVIVSDTSQWDAHDRVRLK